jgi:hypothetical protein
MSSSVLLRTQNPEGARMTYRKVTIELVVHEDNCEGTIQQLSEDLERLQEHTTIFCADIRDETTDTPENAEEIAAG